MSNYTYKIVVIGDGSVGKTSLIHRCVENKFALTYKETIGIDLFNHSFDIEFDNQIFNVTLLMYDLGGQDYWKKLRADFYNRAKGIIMVYDGSRPETFTNLENWYNEALDSIGYAVPGIILGNKNDLENKVSESMYNQLVEKFNYSHYSVSAKTGKSVLESFKEICKLILVADSVKS